MQQRKKGGVVPQKSTLETFNPEDATREILIKPSKKKKKESTKITISIKPTFKISKNGEISSYDIKCWINGKLVKNPKLKITYRGLDLKY